jgi:transposase
VLFLGDDWAETHHDIELQDEQGKVLKRRRLPEGVTGLTQLHELIADHLDDEDEPESVLVGIETDRGGWVHALIAAGYTVYAINPKQAARYRERLTTSGAKSDPGDAHVLAEIVRQDRDHHRVVAGDSELAEVVKTVARTHQTMIWTRQRQANQLRSMLREFYPAALEAFGDDLAGRDALAVLAIAPTPAAGRAYPGRGSSACSAKPDDSGTCRNGPRRSRPSCAPNTSGYPTRSPRPTASASVRWSR